MPLRWRVIACAAGAWLAVLAAVPASAQTGPSCPPAFIENKAEAAKRKAALKEKLADAGVPPRLQKLVDSLPDCRACIQAAEETDRLTIVEVYSDEGRRAQEHAARLHSGAENTHHAL